MAFHIEPGSSCGRRAHLYTSHIRSGCNWIRRIDGCKHGELIATGQAETQWLSISPDGYRSVELCHLSVCQSVSLSVCLLPHQLHQENKESSQSRLSDSRSLRSSGSLREPHRVSRSEPYLAVCHCGSLSAPVEYLGLSLTLTKNLGAHLGISLMLTEYDRNHFSESP